MFALFFLSKGNIHLSKHKQPLAVSRQQFNYGLNFSAHLGIGHTQPHLKLYKMAKQKKKGIFFSVQNFCGKANRPEKKICVNKYM